MSLGNTVVNSIYNVNTSDVKDLVPLTANSPQPVRDAWIPAKYVKKLFVNYHWDGDDEIGSTGVFLGYGECTVIPSSQ